MNWYQRYKISMPLPAADNYPADQGYNAGLRFIDRHLEQDQADALSQENLSYLGHGNNGVAFTGSTTGVIKVTGDHSEARAGEMLMQKPCPCIVKVFEVQQLSGANSRLWRLRLEQVQPLSGEDSKWVTLFASYVDGRMELEPIDDILDQVKRGKSWYYTEYFGSQPFNPKVFQFYYDKFNDFIDCIYLSGYECLDLVPANIGMRGNQYVVLDIGSVYRV